MPFKIGQASLDHLSEIMEIMEEARETIEREEWFAADDSDYVRQVLAGKGFVVGAWEKKTGEMAGFFMVFYPDKEKNLGIYGGLTPEELAQVVYMDSAAVKKRYRGKHLQERMLWKAEEILLENQKRAGEGVQFRMCTIHPQNEYSLRNMEKNGYQVIAKASLYGGLDRYILLKKILVQ